MQCYVIKYRTDVVLAAISCFAYLKMNATKVENVNRHIRIQYTQIMHKQAEKKICPQMSSKISAQAKYTHFQKKLQYSGIYSGHVQI